MIVLPKKRPSWGGTTTTTTTTTPAKPAKPVEDPLAAMRKLEELQLQHSSSKSLSKAPTAAPASTSGAASSSKPYDYAAPGPAPSSSASAITSPGSSSIVGDWTCKTCSTANLDAHGDCTVPSGFKFCPTCGDSSTGVPNRLPAPTSVAEEWVCHCGEVCPHIAG